MPLRSCARTKSSAWLSSALPPSSAAVHAEAWCPSEEYHERPSSIFWHHVTGCEVPSSPIGAGGVGRLVHRHQRAHVLRRVDVPLVPLVGVGERRLEALRQRAGGVADVDGAALATRRLGVAGRGRAHEATVEGVHVVLGLVGRPGRVVDADEAAATADVGLERGALLGVEEHARGVGEDQEVLGGQVLRGERGGVGRLLDVGDGRAAAVVVQAVLGGEGVGHLPHRGAGVGHRAVHAVAAGEQQDAQHVVVGRGGGSGGRGLEGGDGGLGAAGSQRQRDGQRGRHGHEVR